MVKIAQESLVTQPWLLDVPFHNPALSLSEVTPTGIVTQYDPSVIDQYTTLKAAIEAVATTYDEEKSPERKARQRQDGVGIDLTIPSHVEGIVHHTLTHAIAGYVPWGTSDTTSIPLWDRDAAIQGLRHVEGQFAAPEIATADALCINALRTFCRHFANRSEVNALEGDLLTEAMGQGMRSLNDVRMMQQEALGALRRDGGIVRRLFVEKMRHLLWLTDQQPAQEVRAHVHEELARLIGRAVQVGIPAEAFTVDLGTDAGLTTDTNRPPYIITAFRQLRYLGRDTYELSPRDCHVLPVDDMMRSIARPGETGPGYDDGRYRLPLKF